MLSKLQNFLAKKHKASHEDLSQILNEFNVPSIEHTAMDEAVKMIAQYKAAGRDESFGIFDVGEVIKRFDVWKESFPHVRPYYAVKGNRDPVVLKILHQLGAGFDCASKGEIEHVLDVGATGDDIIFANAVKFRSHLEYAKMNGISLMTFDNLHELEKIKDVFPRARLLLRIIPGGASPAEIKIDRKFGCHMEDVDSLLKKAKELELCIVGVCFHVGSGCSDPEYFVQQIMAAKEVFLRAKEEGFNMTILDIGGGFPGRVESENIIRKISVPIWKGIEEAFEDIDQLQVIAEPGRYFVESALLLAASVVGIATRSSIRHYYLSESVFGILNRRHLYSRFFHLGYEAHPVMENDTVDSDDLVKSTLWGPTCAPMDLIQEITYLPKLEIGDWLVFLDTGVYSSVMSSNFNGMPLAKIYYIISCNITN